MARDLNLSWWSELMYQDLMQKLSIDFKAIMVGWSEDLPTTLNNQESQSLLGLLDLEWQRRDLLEIGGFKEVMPWLLMDLKLIQAIPS